MKIEAIHVGMRVKHPQRYLEAVAAGMPVQEEREVGMEAVGFEFMMNALRLNDGFPVQLFEERAGAPLTAVLRPLEEAERRGLIVRDHARVAPTARGRRFQSARARATCKAASALSPPFSRGTSATS